MESTPLFAFLTAIPILNSFVFFSMNSRVEKKKWVYMGWLTFILQISILTVLLFCFIVPAPTIQYSDMLKYNGDVDLWSQSPEFYGLLDVMTNFFMLRDSLVLAFLVLFIVAYIVVLFLAIIERGKYLKIIKNQDYKEEVRERLERAENGNRVKSTRVTTENIRTTHEQPKKPERVIQTGLTEVVNVNTATEEELVEKLKLTELDAKRILMYRSRNGVYNSKDEFFMSFDAKPHIIVRLEDYVSVVIPQDNPYSNLDKRKIDI